MIRKITNTARDYAWGSTSLISDYFGIAATGEPMAEIWFGTHDGSPTALVGAEGTLLSLRDGEHLPFLVKILAAGQPLSIQAHPNKEQAEAGFARENELGLALSDPERDYKDDNHKPEIIVALTDFTALAGFRPLVDTIISFQRIVMQAQALNLTTLERAFADWIAVLRQAGLSALVTGLLNRPENLAEVCDELAQLAVLSRTVQNVESQNLALVPQLQELYPGDPGVIISQLMNVVELAPNESMEVNAGVVHAYVSGLGVEVMASSDNVLRGGLTQKHINTEELKNVLDYSTALIRPDSAKTETQGLYRYPSRNKDYIVYRVEVGAANILADLKLPNAAIVVCTAGEIAVGDSKEERQVLRKGEAAYLADANFYSFSGSGTGFLVTN
ncbi:MAG: hypothetical protein RIR34_1392 [Actinomycetota bacterium]